MTVLGERRRGHVGVAAPTSGPTDDEVADAAGAVRHERAVRGGFARPVRRRRRLAAAWQRAVRHVRVGRGLHLRAPCAVLRWHGRAACAGRAHQGRACAGVPGRLHHHRPHLACGRHRAGLPGGDVPGGTRRRSGGLQHLRCPSRQPRGHDARHVRQREAVRTSWPRARRAAGRATS